MKQLLAVNLLLFLLSCQSNKKEINLAFAEKVEQAHKKKDFLAKEAIEFEIEIIFGGNERLNGKMTLLTNSNKSLIELKNGQKIYQVGQKVYCSPEMDDATGARFDAYTWAYFFLFPYKLNDNGTIWSDFETNTLNDESYLTNKLSFENGTGDAPDDWYIVYADENTHQINTVAYVVTAHAAKEKAEEDPHAITYSNYEEVEGIPMAKTWTYYEWDLKKG